VRREAYPGIQISAACHNLTNQDVMTYLGSHSGMPAVWPTINNLNILHRASIGTSKSIFLIARISWTSLSPNPIQSSAVFRSTRHRGTNGHRRASKPLQFRGFVHKKLRSPHEYDESGDMIYLQSSSIPKIRQHGLRPQISQDRVTCRRGVHAI